MSTMSGYETGTVDDLRVIHAMRPSLDGYTACCGAGTTAAVVKGRFDLDDVTSCPACVAAALAAVPRPRLASA